jgi:alpha-L-rhamnosidase
MRVFALISLLLLGSFTIQLPAQKCRPVALSVENLINPLGIDANQPRLKWMMSDDRTGAFQTAFRLRIGTDSARVAKGKGNFWDTGIVSGSQMIVVYEGTSALKPFTRYFWTVQLWDHAGKKGALSEVASFETGMMGMQNWQGEWISDSKDVNWKPAPYFRDEFIPSGKVKSARAYITAAGLFELSLNGKRVGDHALIRYIPASISGICTLLSM